MLFDDREAAGHILAGELAEYAGQPAVVLALPRGGVPVGAAVADDLGLPLDLVIARKIGHPLWAEYAIGAVTETGPVIWNPQERQQVDEDWAAMAVALARKEAERRRNLYEAERPVADLAGKIAIIVDDGAATGLTLQAAIADVRERQARRIVVALPVAPPEVAKKLAAIADEVIVAHIPPYGFGAVGAYYRHFDQVSDAAVEQYLRRVANVHQRSLRHS